VNNTPTNALYSSFTRELHFLFPVLKHPRMRVFSLCPPSWFFRGWCYILGSVFHWIAAR